MRGDEVGQFGVDVPEERIPRATGLTHRPVPGDRLRRDLHPLGVAVRSPADERRRRTVAHLHAITFGQPREGPGQGRQRLVARHLVGEVTDQTDQLAEALVPARREPLQPPLDRAVVGLPHPPVAVDHEVVRDVGPPLGLAGVEVEVALQDRRHLVGLVLESVGGVVYQQEPHVLLGHLTLRRSIRPGPSGAGQHLEARRHRHRRDVDGVDGSLAARRLRARR